MKKSLLCSFGFHDWEIVKSKRASKIKHMVEHPIGIIGYRIRDEKSYHHRVCLRCGESVDEIDVVFERYKREYFDAKNRRTLADKLIRQMEAEV